MPDTYEAVSQTRHNSSCSITLESSDSSHCSIEVGRLQLTQLISKLSFGFPCLITLLQCQHPNI